MGSETVLLERLMNELSESWMLYTAMRLRTKDFFFFFQSLANHQSVSFHSLHNKDNDQIAGLFSNSEEALTNFQSTQSISRLT